MQNSPLGRNNPPPRSLAARRCYAQIRATETAYLAYGTCNGRYVCTQLGYFDDHEAMGMYTVTKTYLAICICIQLFKILKFAAILVPKMGLASAVLRKYAAPPSRRHRHRHHHHHLLLHHHHSYHALPRASDRCTL